MTPPVVYRSRRALVLVLTLAVSAACGGSSSTAPTPAQTWVANVPFSTTDLTVGTGEEVVAGQTISVDYFGWLYSTAAADNKGSLFDTSCPNACNPLQFAVGSGRLIRGFERGVVGMRVGGVRRMIIPPDLAYGAAGSGSAIPPNATIIFEVRVNGIVTVTGT